MRARRSLQRPQASFKLSLRWLGQHDFAK